MAGVGQSVPLDSVQEFRIITSNFSAEYGRASGGIVNVATRAGSNTFHGGSFYQVRNTALDANYYFNNETNLPRDVIKLTQRGIHIGGKGRECRDQR